MSRIKKRFDEFTGSGNIPEFPEFENLPEEGRAVPETTEEREERRLAEIAADEKMIAFRAGYPADDAEDSQGEVY